ncbi:hypothetical protein ACS5PN_11345 [Roseateles sp. NT4]|uniref:hypothetical protein n=1 Tax=Roseateles sp. NT4 TaxID=3453715 RepID=UPI003EEF41A4
MTDTPKTTSNEQSGGVVTEIYQQAKQQLKHSAVAGFVFTAILVFLAQRSGAEGKNSLELLRQFVDHSLPNKTLYIVALGLLGLSITFSKSFMAELLRTWIAKPLIELSSHAFAVALGILLALFASAGYVADLRDSAGATFSAAFVAFTVYGILQIAQAAAEGRFDEQIQSAKIYEVAAGVAGLCITYAAISDFSVELEHAAEHKKKCAPAEQSAVQPAQRSAPASQPQH